MDQLANIHSAIINEPKASLTGIAPPSI
ncbi:hypothetical protein LSH36_185g02000 [Paralvinella palmiformis]|uniref:Uncharacterized protein n=1 Tax=Paralvinella palmiformis TaxID=53620 RepID=A0AAD9JQX7_9ANNE|nr:hypothetical protein LSH36_185g02000 [Paralvinella palmiformis]